MADISLAAALRHIRTLTDAPFVEGATDGQLLERFVGRREEAAFAALLRRHGPMVLGVCRRVVGRLQDAEDAFQATFLLLARKASSIRKQGSVGSWLHGVAHRIAVKAKGQDDCRRVHERRAGSMRKTETGVQAAWMDLQETLDEALQALPDCYRAALVICHLEGRTHEEAARQLGCPTATLRSRLTRGRKLLRKELTRRGLALPAGAVGVALLANVAEAAPATLVNATVKAALHFACSGTTAGAVLTTAAALAEEGMKAMATTKIKMLAMLLAALSLVGVCVSAVAQQAAAAKPPEAKPAAERPPPADDDAKPHLDDDGEALPAGAVRRVGTLRFRQGGGLGGAVFPCPDGKTLVSGFYCGDRTICLWDLDTGKLRRSFPTGYENILFALSPDGRTLVETHQANWAIRLWDVASGKESRRLEWKDGSCWPSSFAFSPDGKTLASGNVRGSIDLWDLTAGKHAANLKTPKEMIRAIVFTPDGKTLVAAAVNTITLWDVASGKELRTLTRPKDISLVAVSPDGALLASGSAEDGIALWGMSGGKVVHEWPATRLLSSLTFSPDGKTLTSTEGDEDYDAIVLRDVNSGKDRRRIKAAGVISVAYSTDGKTLICAHIGGTIRQWDAETGRERTPTPGRQRPSHATFSPDGRTLAFVEDADRCFNSDRIRFWDMAAGREIGELPMESERVDVLAFAPDGKSLASITDQHTIRLWDVGARKVLRMLDTDKMADNSLIAFAFAPDGKTLATGEGDGSVRLRDVAGVEAPRRLNWRRQEEPESYVASVAFAPDGGRLAAAGWTPGYGVRVRLWDAGAAGELPRLAWEASTSDMPGVGGGDEVDLPGNIALPNIIFSPDGRMMAVQRWQKTIPIWEASTGKERLLLAGHKQLVACAAVAPDGRTLASAGCDDTIRLWDLGTGEELRTLTGHRGKANSLAFSADGKTLVSTGDDTTLLFWDVAEITHRPRPKARVLSPGECEALWADLAADDAAKAYRAIRAMIAAPTATAFLGNRLRPARAIGAGDLDRLIADLDSDDFAVREKATHDLDDIGEAAGPGLRRAVVGQPSAEVRTRASGLLEKLATPAPELLRGLRAIEALEGIGGPEARQVLERIAKGAADSRLTREANAALRRMMRS